jgi:Glycosyl transferase family 2
VRLTVVIPTRNRADLAATALRSVAEQAAGVALVVSDNSTEPSETAALRALCHEREGVVYVRPPEPLAMSPHWEWALDTAVAATDPTHVTYLTDRMIFRPGHLAALLALVARHRDQVMTYNHDRVDDLRRPVRLYQKRWSGRLLRVPAARLLERASRSVPLVWAPRMLNSVVPVPVIDAVRRRFGSLFQSISPDFCFAFRSLAVVPEILFWDRSPLVHYAMDRSNGASTARGVPNRDAADFLRALGATTVNHEAPVPAFRTVHNAVIHEYCAVRRQVGGALLPEVDREAYLQAIVGEVREIEDPALRSQMEALLALEGPIGRARSRTHLLRSLKRTMAGFSASPFQPLWRALSRQFGLWPPGENALEFPSREAALEHARRYPRRRYPSTMHLRFVLGPLEAVD